MISKVADGANTVPTLAKEELRRGYYIYVTEACNLRCSYCFVKDKHNDRHLSMAMAKQILDFIARDAEGRSSAYVHFFGGEPLLQPAMIDYLASSLRTWSSGRDLKLRLGITTNGTLLSTENCMLLKRHNIGVQLSLDGSKDGNDIHRQFMGGSQCGLRTAGAFDKVNIPNFMTHFGKSAPNCRMTLTTENLSYLSRSIRELHGLGFASFSVIPDCDTGSWTSEHIAEYERVMTEVLHYWSQHDNLWISSFDKTIRSLLTKQQPRSLCKVGTGILGITVDGELYPCHDFSGRYSSDNRIGRSLTIGHVATGYNENLKQFLDMSIGSDVRSGCGYDCASCWAQTTCSRGCPYMNYVSAGDIRIVNQTYCATKRVDTLLVLKWMATTNLVRFSSLNDSVKMRPMAPQQAVTGLVSSPASF